MLVVAVTTFVYVPSEVSFPIQQGSSLSQGECALFEPPVARTKDGTGKCLAAEPCFSNVSILGRDSLCLLKF